MKNEDELNKKIQNIFREKELFHLECAKLPLEKKEA